MDAREVIERQAREEPHAISAYRDQRHFEETISDAASRIMRFNGLRLQWYALTVGGVALIVLTLLKFIALDIIHEPGVFLSGPLLVAAWAIALVWTWLYNLQVRGFSRRIIRKRLCLRCGKSLLEAAFDEHDCGVCPNCCVVFKLGEYIPPTDCIEALRRTKQRIGPTRGPLAGASRPLRRPRPHLAGTSPPIVPRSDDLYLNLRQFNQVMSRAARRLVLHDRAGLRTRIGVYAGMLPVAFFALLFVLLGADGLYLAPLGWAVTIGAAMVLMYILVSIAVTRSRILEYRLCLSCGQSLQDVRVDTKGVGACPRCRRQFHAREYNAPDMHVNNEFWMANRRALFNPIPDIGSNRLIPPPVPYVEEPVRLEDPPGSGRLAKLQRCVSCGYILEGSPIDERGKGVCSECGRVFRRHPPSEV